MTESFDHFMVFLLEDSGEYKRLDITEDKFRENNGRNVLNDEQVAIIIKEDLRRIYLWKGSKSSVRKRFISSRVASELQEEMVKDASFHRCKVISIDQGDELDEFLRTFNFTAMKVSEKLADMYYVRNIDRDKMYDRGEFPDTAPKFVKPEDKPIEQISPELKESPKSDVKEKKPIKTVKKASTKPEIKIKPEEKIKETEINQVQFVHSNNESLPSTLSKEFTEEKNKTIKEKILKMDVPKEYKRQNLILGHFLYGAVNKIVNVLGKKLQETDWEIVKNVPTGMIELDNNKIRVYFDEKKGIVEAIEILELTEEKIEKEIEKENIITEKIISVEEDKSISKQPPKKIEKSVKKEKLKPEVPKTEVKKIISKEKLKAEEPKIDEKKPILKEEEVVKEESLEKIDLDSMPVKDLRTLAEKHQIEINPTARKQELIKLLKDKIAKSETASTKRKLPEIPKA